MQILWSELDVPRRNLCKSGLDNPPTAAKDQLYTVGLLLVFVIRLPCALSAAPSCSSHAPSFVARKLHIQAQLVVRYQHPSHDDKNMSTSLDEKSPSV
jgi:hypothetical protein